MRVMRPAAISQTRMSPSGRTTGPSGKRSPPAISLSSVMSRAPLPFAILAGRNRRERPYPWTEARPSISARARTIAPRPARSRSNASTPAASAASGARATTTIPPAWSAPRSPRYAERIHHPDRVLHPLVRTGPKGSGQFKRISWDDALDLCAEKFLEAEAKFGPETVWPYYYAGTMGLVQRDGINRLRHAKRYSGFHATICTTLAWNGFIAGTGRLAGSDPRRDGEGRPAGDLGHQRRQHPGERDDARGPGPQGAWRTHCRHRRLSQRDGEAGRLLPLRAPRYGRRARLRDHACAVPRRLCRPGPGWRR